MVHLPLWLQKIHKDDVKNLIRPAYEQAVNNLILLMNQTAGGINLKELMKPRTKVIPGRFALRK